MKSTLLALVLIHFVATHADAQSDRVTTRYFVISKITKMYSIYWIHPPQNRPLVNPANCVFDDAYDYSTPAGDDGLLNAAFLAGKPVRLTIEGCNPATSRPRVVQYEIRK